MIGYWLTSALLPLLRRLLDGDALVIAGDGGASTAPRRQPGPPGQGRRTTRPRSAGRLHEAEIEACEGYLVSGGRLAAIGALDEATEILDGRRGTRVR